MAVEIDWRSEIGDYDIEKGSSSETGNAFLGTFDVFEYNMTFLL